MNAPNGEISYLETHFLIVEFIVAKRKDIDLLPASEIKTAYEDGGTKGLWPLAQQWTDEFEERYKGEDWEELDFYDTIEAFCEEKNNEQINFNNYD